MQDSAHLDQPGADDAAPGTRPTAEADAEVTGRMTDDPRTRPDAAGAAPSAAHADPSPGRDRARTTGRLWRQRRKDGRTTSSAVGRAARRATRSIREGIEAFRSVRVASQRHSSALEELRDMRERLEADASELDRRIDIEQRYPQILSEQTAERDEATARSEEALRRHEALAAERDELEGQLVAMRAHHEDQLRPYRNVSESAKGRADDAARALADARRATKGAEGTLAEATRRRDQRISAANRAVDSAQDRLRRVQAELDALRDDAEASPAALSRLQGELVAERAHLDAAKGDVPAVTEGARRSVEEAQERLFDLRRLLAQAEGDAETAKREATARRAEYDSLLKEAKEEERALSEQVRLRTTAAEQAKREHGEAEARVRVARELLDEAQAVHATPQDTIDLRALVERERGDLDAAGRRRRARDRRAGAEARDPQAAPGPRAGRRRGRRAHHRRGRGDRLGVAQALLRRADRYRRQRGAVVGAGKPRLAARAGRRVRPEASRRRTRRSGTPVRWRPGRPLAPAHGSRTRRPASSGSSGARGSW